MPNLPLKPKQGGGLKSPALAIAENQILLRPSGELRYFLGVIFFAFLDSFAFFKPEEPGNAHARADLLRVAFNIFADCHFFARVEYFRYTTFNHRRRISTQLVQHQSASSIRQQSTASRARQLAVYAKCFPRRASA